MTEGRALDASARARVARRWGERVVQPKVVSKFVGKHGASGGAVAPGATCRGARPNAIAAQDHSIKVARLEAHPCRQGCKAHRTTE